MNFSNFHDSLSSIYDCAESEIFVCYERHSNTQKEIHELSWKTVTPALNTLGNKKKLAIYKEQYNIELKLYSVGKI